MLKMSKEFRKELESLPGYRKRIMEIRTQRMLKQVRKAMALAACRITYNETHPDTKLNELMREADEIVKHHGELNCMHEATYRAIQLYRKMCASIDLKP